MGTADETRAYYDARAGEYDLRTGFDLEGGQAWNFHRYYEPFLDRVLPRTGRVLELGCGTGFYTRWLAERGLDVTALDISEQMVERARARCPGVVEIRVADCTDPGSALGPDRVGDGFDAIVGINTFSYYPGKRAALARYRDLLRPGGRLVFLDMNGTSFTQQLAYLLDYRGARRFRPNVDQSTPARLRKALTEVGLEVEELERFSFVPNEAGPATTAVFAALDAVLSRIPGAKRFAVRLGLVARRS